MRPICMSTRTGTADWISGELWTSIIAMMAKTKIRKRTCEFAVNDRGRFSQMAQTQAKQNVYNYKEWHI